MHTMPRNVLGQDRRNQQLPSHRVYAEEAGEGNWTLSTTLKLPHQWALTVPAKCHSRPLVAQKTGYEVLPMAALLCLGGKTSP
jgi:hypothetical protein